ncbi:MAG: Peptidase protein [Patescibacteria group bacterium]|nr:Peptidase protein [Patescibacteria group bacterium]
MILKINNFKMVFVNKIISGVLVTLIFSTFTFLNVYSQSESDLKNQIQNNNDQIKKLEQEIADYNDKIKSKQADAKTLKSAISILENSKAALEKDIKVSNLKIENMKQNITQTEKEINTTSQKLDKLREGLGKSFREMSYTSSLKNNFSFVLLGSNNLSDIFDRYNEVENFKSNVSDNITYFNQTRQILKENNDNYKSQTKTLESLKDNLQDKKVLVVENQNEKNQLLKVTKNQESSYQAMLNSTKEKKAALEQEIADYEAKLKAFTNTSSLPQSGSEALDYPVKKIVITQYFGNTPFATKNPQVYNGSGHNGIDFGVPVGTAIYSASDGVIVDTGNTDAACSGASFGKWILIKHNNGLTTLYAHLSSIGVSSGQSVSRGDKIGLSGNTGYSTGPHLHFTVYASEAVHVSGPTEYRSKACGTYMVLPLASKSGYLNPLTYLPK